MIPKRTRNRPAKPAWSYSGLDSHQWRADNSRVLWAQTAPHFRDLLTVLTNERVRALLQPPGVSENRLLGRAEGYEAALGVLRELAAGAEPPAPKPDEPTYQSEEAGIAVTD